MDEWRRKEKRKERAKHKKTSKVEDASLDEWKDKDPNPLIREIQKLQVTEIEGKMTPILRTRKNKLMERFQKIRSAKVSAGLEAPEIPDLDYESLKKQIAKDAKGKRRGDLTATKDILDEYDDGSLPAIPLGVAPPHELIAHLILKEAFPEEKFSISSQPTPEYEDEDAGDYRPIAPTAIGQLSHPSANAGVMTMLQVKEKAYEIEQRQLESIEILSNVTNATNEKRKSSLLVADYDEEDEDEDEDKKVLPNAFQVLEKAPSNVVKSSEPVLRNLQKELIHMVPASLLRKKLKK